MEKGTSFPRGEGFYFNDKGTEGKHGAWDQDKKRRKGRGNFTLDHRYHFDSFCLFHRRDLALDRWIDRGGIYPDCDIWILTLKGIFAEGLQQRR
jgi:hypothetical protein